jgi:HEPN domain-containing protein
LGRAALDSKGVLPEDAAFHAQQCAEKALLDLLKAQGTKIPRGVDESFELSEYAVQTRYPGEWEPVTKTEARKAVERAGLVLAWVESQLK